MTTPNLLEVLAHLYPDPTNARRVVDDAGLDKMKIDFEGAACQYWSAILKEAIYSDKVEDLVEIARQEYPNNEDLLAAWNAYLTHDGQAELIELLNADADTWVGVGPLIGNFQTDYQAYFAGRDREFANLNAWLTQSDTRLALMVAPAGRGKSAVVTNWTKYLVDSNSAQVVFHPISLRYGTDGLHATVSNLITQLEEKLSLNPAYRSQKVEKWNLAASIARLNELLRTPPASDKPLVVVIDGLDELNIHRRNRTEAAEHFSDDLLALKLPAQVADGIHLLVTVRGDNDSDRGSWRSRLLWDKAKVQFFDLDKLSLSGIIHLVEAYNLPVDRLTANELAQQIYRLSEEGDPLLASLWLGRLKSQFEMPENDETTFDIHQLETYAPGMDSHTLGIVDELKQRGVTAQALFELLCLARGPLSESDLATLGIAVEMKPYELVRHSGGLIISNTVPGSSPKQATFVLSHSRIGQVYRENHLPSDKERYWIDRLCEYGQNTLHQLRSQYQRHEQLQASHYLLRHYSEHLYYDAPKQYGKIFALIDEVWMQAHYQLLGTHENFLIDASRAWEIADKLGQQEVEQGKCVSTLNIQMKATQCLTSIASMAQQYPPSLPALLVYVGTWTLQQAQDYIRHIPETVQRIRARLALLKYHKLPDHQLEELATEVLTDLEMMATPDNEALCCHLSLAVFEHITQDFQIRRAIGQANRIQSPEWRVYLFASLLGKHTSSTSQVELQTEVLQQCAQLSTLRSLNEQHLMPYILQTIADNLSYKVLYQSLMDAFDIDKLSADWEQHNDEARKRSELIEKRNILLYLLAQHVPPQHADEYLATCFRFGPWNYSTSFEATVILLAPKLSPNGITNATNALLEIEYDEVFNRYNDSFRAKTLCHSPTVALLSLMQYSSSNRSELKTKVLDKITQFAGANLPESKTRRTVYMLLQYIMGECTDKELATQFYNDSIRIEQVDDYPVFALLGPHSMKAVIEQWHKYSDIEWGGQRLRSSPYFLESVVQRMNDEDLHLALSFARQDDFRDFEMWSYYCALIQVGNRLLDKQFATISDSLVDSVLRNDAGYESTVAVTLSLAPRLQTDQAQKLINRLSGNANWEYWLLRDSLISALKSQVAAQLIPLHLSNYQLNQTLNEGQLLAELALNSAKESAEPIARILHQYTQRILDLPKRFEMLESLRVRNRKQTKHWQSKIREQAVEELCVSNVPLDYTLRILKFAPVSQRIKFRYQRQNRLSEQQQAPANRWWIAPAFWYGLTDSLRLRQITFVLLIPFTALFARSLQTQKAQRPTDSQAEERFRQFFTEFYAAKEYGEGVTQAEQTIKSKREILIAKYLQVWVNSVGRLGQYLREAFLKLGQSLLHLYVRLHGWCLEVPQIARFTMWLFEKVVGITSQGSVESERKALESNLHEDQQISLPDIPSILHDYTKEHTEIDNNVLSNIFNQLDLPYGSAARRIALRKRGTELWSLLPDDKFDVALTAIFSEHDDDQQIKGVLILLPALATRRPDLLPKLREKLSSDHYQYGHIQIWVPPSLAFYFPEEEQKSLILHALDRAAHYQMEALHWYGLIFDEVIEYADDALLPWVGEQLLSHHSTSSLGSDRSYYAAIRRLAFRIRDDMQLLDAMWPLIDKMSQRQRQEIFVIIAPTLNVTYLVQILSLLFEEEEQDEFTTVYFALRERWLELPLEDAYKVWTAVLPAISRQPRHLYFKTMLMFSKVVLKLGSPEAIAVVGDDILDVSRWRWF